MEIKKKDLHQNVDMISEQVKFNFNDKIVYLTTLLNSLKMFLPKTLIYKNNM
jgi:hypothetical protein